MAFSISYNTNLLSGFKNTEWNESKTKQTTFQMTWISIITLLTWISQKAHNIHKYRKALIASRDNLYTDHIHDFEWTFPANAPLLRS